MKKTAFDIIREIGSEVEGRIVPLEKMIRDIQMMRFKVRSVFGDISQIESMHYDFVHALWRIGKIDEIISESFHDVSDEDQEKLLDYFSHIEEETQNMIGTSLEIKPLKSQKKPPLKIELFKDLSSSKSN